MREIFCFSTQDSFQKKLPEGFEDDLKRCLDADEVVFCQFKVDGSGQYYTTDIDWGKMGYTTVVLCDDPHEAVLQTFFYEAYAEADLKGTYWYSRYNGVPSLIEILSTAKMSTN